VSGGDRSANLRAAAARAVLEVTDRGHTLESAVAGAAAGLPPGDRAALQAITFGTIRSLLRLQPAIATLANRDWSKTAAPVRALLLTGTFELEDAATPPHAVVTSTVEAARLLGQPKAAGYVNALLRRWQRERATALFASDRSPAGRHAHPNWLVQQLEKDWGAGAADILAANNARAPMWLRVNLSRTTRAAYQAQLAAAGIDATPCAWVPSALRLAQPVDVLALPGFADGLCSVQDAAAQLAPYLLAAPAPGTPCRVLDACAAPGGKTGHLLEAWPQAVVTALDSDAARAARITDNLARLGLEARATVRVADAADPASWWDGQRFDRIVLDVPCSGTGVIRRHPDIKLLRRATDIAGFVATQEKLLQALWPLVAPGGQLLYASCSVLKAENGVLLRRFLRQSPDAVDVTESARLHLATLFEGGGALPATVTPGLPGLALLTGAAEQDGFGYAVLERRGHEDAVHAGTRPQEQP
jgi:16S rRNA (cytosine967-C5)-methyltransferase